MPILWAGRLLKRWRYVGVYGPEVMLCAGIARIGPTLQSFWAVWDREARCLHERTRPGRGGVRFARGRAVVEDEAVRLDLKWDEVPGVEIVTPDGDGYAWTRKQGGVEVTGTLELAGQRRALRARAIVDDSAGYHARRTAWRWSAGVGAVADGRSVAWNLVAGVHDSATASERTVWLAGEPREVEPVRFDDDLGGVRGDGESDGGLRFAREATRERHDDLLVFRSDYVQPFGSFTGRLPGGLELSEGWGVMERHEVLW
jgi:Protein of unknown function (DUF2804)